MTGCLKKNLKASRPSEHPIFKGENVDWLLFKFLTLSVLIGCQPEKTTSHGGQYNIYVANINIYRVCFFFTLINRSGFNHHSIRVVVQVHRQTDVNGADKQHAALV